MMLNNCLLAAKVLAGNGRHAQYGRSSTILVALLMVLASCAGTPAEDCPEGSASAAGECQAAGGGDWSEKAAEEAEGRFDETGPGLRR